MAKMKQLWWLDENKIDLIDVDIPAVGPGEVKVKIAYAALCATDVHQVTMGVMNSKPPFAITHAPGCMLITDTKNINLKE